MGVNPLAVCCGEGLPGFLPGAQVARLRFPNNLYLLFCL